MNQHFSALKYVALAQKASSNHALAINTMKNAILYKTPWNDKNIEKIELFCVAWNYYVKLLILQPPPYSNTKKEFK